MISPGNHDLKAMNLRYPVEKMEIKFLCTVARGSIVEDIPRDQQNIDLFIADTPRHPVEEPFVLIIPPPPMQDVAKMPVRSMEDFHILSQGEAVGMIEGKNCSYIRWRSAGRKWTMREE